MSALTICLISGLSISIILLAVSVYYNIKFGTLILQYVDQIEVTLDVFDKKYSSISTIIEKPLFYDSPEIREVLGDVRDCRDCILEAANVLGSIESIEEEA